MKHPFLINIRTIVAYTIFWLIVIAFSAWLSYNKYALPFGVALTDSLVFCTLFAILGLSLWYPLQYTIIERNSLFSFILNHLTAASTLILIWLLVGYGISTAINSYYQPYSGMLKQSIVPAILTGLILYILYALFYYLIMYYRDLKEKRQNEILLLAKVKESELNLLKSQINPHFLFNSLNSISSLTLTNASKAQEMIIKLSDFLRYSIARDNKQKAPLKSELENLQRYLDIEKVRFGNRLEYITNIDQECIHATLPIMILQPLFENAIKHGVYESTETIRLEVTCHMIDHLLEITIRNNFDPEAPVRKGAGIGLQNIKERLRLIYHVDGLMKTQKSNCDFEVKLVIPQTEQI